MRAKLHLRAECVGDTQAFTFSLPSTAGGPRYSGSYRRLLSVKPFALFLALMFLSARQASGQEIATHRVTFNDLRSLKFAKPGMSLSPDGRRLAYVVDGDIWLVATEPGVSPKRVAIGDLPLWSPQNDRFAYYSSRSGSLQFWIFDAKTNRSEQISHFAAGIDPDPWMKLRGAFGDSLRYSWSPDGRYLVFASRVATKDKVSESARDTREISGAALKPGTPLILTATTPPNWTLRGVFAHGFGAGAWKNGKVSWEPDLALPKPTRKVNQLFLLDTKKKTVRQLTQDDFGYGQPDWSPDGTRILCVSNEGISLEGGSARTNIYSIDVVTGRKTALTSGQDDKFTPSWSPDGKRIAYRGGKHFGIVHVFLVPEEGGPVTVVAPVDRSIEEHRWMRNSELVLTYRDGVSVSVARVEIQTGAVKAATAQEAAYRTSLTASRSGSVAWQEYGPTTASVIRFVRAGENIARVLIDPNPQIGQWELGEQEVVRWKNRHGDEMEGLLLKPVGYQEGRRYPLIVDLYPSQQNSLKGPLSGNQVWASKGYAVFWPNARAPHVWMNPFKSEAFSRAAKGPDGWEITIDDVMSGVDELIRRGIVDRERMGLYGFSNGGGIVNYLVTQTDRFKCAVSVAGAVSDWLRLALLQTDSKFPDFEGGDNPWSDPEPYIQLSAVFRLQNVTTPLLLADGDQDDEFLLNTIEMYNGLRRFGKEVTFLRYRDQEHGFTGAALEDFWRRENAFLDKYLKPDIPAQN